MSERDNEDNILNSIFIDEIIGKANLSEDEVKIISYLSKGFGFSEIANLLNLDYGCFYERQRKLIARLREVIKEMGEKIPDTSNYDRDIEAMELRDKGYSFQSIADVQGISSVAKAQERAKRGRKKTGTPIPERKYISRVRKAPRSCAPRHCAICDKLTLSPRHSLCSVCLSKYDLNEPWVRELIKIDQRDWETITLGREYSYSDMGRDYNGEPISTPK